jgi:poly(beta-D-mannuronate) lyase
MAAGIGCNNRALFTWASTVPYNLFLSEIQPGNSTLPHEVKRGQQATYYHGLSAASLTMMAYLAAPNGVDLYSQGGYALRRLNMLVAK